MTVYPKYAVVGHARTAVYLCALISFFICAYWRPLNKLVSLWYNSDDYAHGFAIIPISIYIIWKKRSALAEIDFNSSSSGLLLIIISLLVYLFSRYAEIESVAAFTIIPCLYGTVLYLLGLKAWKELLFPVTFLIFAMPVPSQIYAWLTIPLQLLVSKTSAELAGFLDCPVFREGNIIHLPDKVFQIVTACSGLRSLISLLAVSTVAGYFMLRSNLLRSVLFLSAVPVAIAVNILRVFLLVAVFYYFRIDLSAGAAHTGLGILTFVLALFTIFISAGILSRWNSPA